MKLIGGLAYRARAMLKAKALEAAGRPLRSAAPAAGLWGMPSGVIARGLSSYGMEELLAFSSALLTADRELKSRRIGGHTTLERAVGRMISRERE